MGINERKNCGIYSGPKKKSKIGSYHVQVTKAEIDDKCVGEKKKQNSFQSPTLVIIHFINTGHLGCGWVLQQPSISKKKVTGQTKSGKRTNLASWSIGILNS